MYVLIEQEKKLHNKNKATVKSKRKVENQKISTQKKNLFIFSLFQNGFFIYRQHM